MFLVGGGILRHGIGPLGHAIEGLAHGLGALEGLATQLLAVVFGVLVGLLCIPVVKLGGLVVGVVSPKRRGTRESEKN